MASTSDQVEVFDGSVLHVKEFERPLFLATQYLFFTDGDHGPLENTLPIYCDAACLAWVVCLQFRGGGSV